MRRFFLTAKPGCDLHSAIENPSYEHSEILEIDTDGTVIGHLPYLPDTDYMYNPEPDPSYRKPQKVITAEGEVEIPTYVPEDKITIGENPFVQLIYRYVKKLGGATEEEIIRHITSEKKHMKSDKKGLKRLRGYIHAMHDGQLSGLLLIQEGKYVAGLQLETGRQLVDLPSGYDPIEYHLMRYIENKNVVSRDEIHRMLIDKYKFLRNTKSVEYYINKLIEDKCIKTVGNNWFQFLSFPDLIL